jgi:uncharacterized protein
MPHTAHLDQQTQATSHAFLNRVTAHYDCIRAVLYGSRAKHTHRETSDVDLAIVLRGTPHDRVDVALVFSGIAFDVMLDTDMLVHALPLWEDEWEHPERFINPALIANIKQDGIVL